MTPELRRLLRVPRPGQAAARPARLTIPADVAIVAGAPGRIEAAQAIHLLNEAAMPQWNPTHFENTTQWTYTWDTTTYAYPTAHGSVANLTLDVPETPNVIVKGDTSPYPRSEPYWSDMKGLTRPDGPYDWTRYIRHPHLADAVPDPVVREVIRHNCRVLQAWWLRQMWRAWSEPLTDSMRVAAERKARRLLIDLVGTKALRYWTGPAPDAIPGHRFIPVDTAHGAFCVVNGFYPKVRTLDIDEGFWCALPLAAQPWERRRRSRSGAILRPHFGYCVTIASYHVEGLREAEEFGIPFTQDDEAAAIILMLHANPQGLADIAVPVQPTDGATRRTYQDAFTEVYGLTKGAKGRALMAGRR